MPRFSLDWNPETAWLEDDEGDDEPSGGAALGWTFAIAGWALATPVVLLVVALLVGGR